MKRAVLILLLLTLCVHGAAIAPLPGPPMNDALWTQRLVGSWCEDPSVGSGYGERWLFTRDELHILPRQYGEGTAHPATCMWRVADGALWVGPNNCSTPLALAGPFSVPDDESPYSPKIEIEGRTFYQYSSDPAYFPDLADYGIAVESDASSPKALARLSEWVAAWLDAGSARQLDEGAINRVAVGQKLSLRLSENRTTPYWWVHEIDDESCVALQSDAYVSDPNPKEMTSVGGTHTYEFIALAEGECTITFKLARVGDEHDFFDLHVFRVVVEGE